MIFTTGLFRKCYGWLVYIRNTMASINILTFGNLREAQAALVAIYPALGPLVTAVQAPDLAPAPHEPFQHLVQAIIHQQVSMAAGRTIMNRLLHLLDDRLEPAVVLATDPDVLKSIGLSRQKLSYLISLASHVQEAPEVYASLPALPDDEIIAHLTAVKGIGLWSAQMYLMFQLWRADVWPWQDLGVQHGVRLLRGLDELPSKAEMLAFAAPCTGYRSLLAWYMWRLKEAPQHLVTS